MKKLLFSAGLFFSLCSLALAADGLLTDLPGGTPIYTNAGSAGTVTNILQLNGGTNNVKSLTTNTYNWPFWVGNYGEVGLMICFTNLGAATSNTVAIIDQGDGTNWFPIASLVTAANGTTNAVNGTNVYFGSFPYGRLRTIANTNSGVNGDITNLLFKILRKPARREYVR